MIPLRHVLTWPLLEAWSRYLATVHMTIQRHSSSNHPLSLLEHNISTMGSVFSSLRECLWLPNYSECLPHTQGTASEMTSTLGTAPSFQRTAPPSMPRFGFDGRSPT